jgi:hypothetical protein
MHIEQKTFVTNLKNSYPQYFSNVKVLEVGSHNVNGTIRDFFHNCEYIGLDVGPGDGVDIVCSGHQYDGEDSHFDITISTECFEHNPYWFDTFLNMIRMCKPGGMVAFTCAGLSRPEHGTNRSQSWTSEHTINVGWGDYYRNLTKEDFTSRINFDRIFSKYVFIDGYYFNSYMQEYPIDLYFWGLKR